MPQSATEWEKYVSVKAKYSKMQFFGGKAYVYLNIHRKMWKNINAKLLRSVTSGGTNLKYRK